MLKLATVQSGQWCKIDDDAEVKLLPLSNLAKMDLIEHGGSYKNKHLVFDSHVCENALRSCAVDWRSVADSDGNEIKFSIDQCLLLPHTSISMMMSHIFNHAFIQDDKVEKKSSAPEPT